MPQTEWHKATKEELLKTLRGFGITPNPAELKGNMVFQILDEETRRHEASKKVYNNLNDPTGQMRIHQARHDKIFYAGERGVLGQYDVRSLAFQWYHDGRSLNHKTHCRELKSAAYDGFETYENNMRLHQQDPENNPEPDAPFFDKYTEGSTNGVELERGRLGPALKGKSKARKAVDEDHEDEKRAQKKARFHEDLRRRAERAEALSGPRLGSPIPDEEDEDTTQMKAVSESLQEALLDAARAAAEQDIEAIATAMVVVEDAKQTFDRLSKINKTEPADKSAVNASSTKSNNSVESPNDKAPNPSAEAVATQASPPSSVPAPPKISADYLKKSGIWAGYVSSQDSPDAPLVYRPQVDLGRDTLPDYVRSTTIHHEKLVKLAYLFIDAKYLPPRGDLCGRLARKLKKFNTNVTCSQNGYCICLRGGVEKKLEQLDNAEKSTQVLFRDWYINTGIEMPPFVFYCYGEEKTVKFGELVGL